VEDTEIDLRIIKSISEIKSITDVRNAKKVIDLYTEADIDFSKFEKRY
jgi:hypothetical protein